MRFLFVTLGYHPDLAGGAYRYASELAEGLAARGHSVVVLTPNPGDRLPASEVRHGVHVHRLPGGPGPSWTHRRTRNRAARVLLEALAREPGGPPLTGLHHAYLAPSLAVAPHPRVFIFHGPWGREFALARQVQGRGAPRRLFDACVARWLQVLERRALRAVDRILVVSQYSRDHLPRWHGAGLPPIHVISGGANLAQFRPWPDRAALREAFGLTAGMFLFLAVRRLDARMGLAGLVDAFARIAPAHPQALLWLAGQGPQRAELETRIGAQGLAGRVRLLGYVPEPELVRLFNAADCTLVPSLDLEGFGLATAESLACGTPVLGSTAGATPELLRPLGEDLLFEAGSVPALAGRLADVLEGRVTLPARAACVRHAEATCTWARPVAALEAQYAELVAGGATP